MITAQGYSKDLSIIPEGIAVTFGQEMIKEHGGLRSFIKEFQQSMQESAEDPENCWWNHICSNLPTIEVDHIYISMCNRLYGKVFCGGFKRAQSLIYLDDEDETQKANDAIAWNCNRIILSGPFERCPFKRELKGFQGFRYTTKLF